MEELKKGREILTCEIGTECRCGNRVRCEDGGIVRSVFGKLELKEEMLEGI